MRLLLSRFPSRRLLLSIVVISWLAVVGSSAVAQQPPNIILIVADDLGWGDLSCYGHEQLKTPNIDRLAAEGTLFTQYYTNGSVCSPTRCAIMTGQYPARHGLHGHLASARENEARGMPNWLDPRVPTITSILRSGNYWTAHFGKWHLGAEGGAPTPAAYGIQNSRTVDSSGESWEPDPDFRAKSSAAIVDEAMRVIRDHRDEPFFINVWTLVPHAPLNPTDEQMRPFDRYSWGEGVRHKSAATIYYASIADLDAQVGVLLEELDRLQLTSNTLVIFTSDNGPEDIHIRNAGHSGIGSAGPFRGRKRSLYEGGIRVPFIARWPARIPAGRIDNDSVISSVDLLPTLCRITGMTLDESVLDGEDVSDILLGQSRARTKPLMWEWRFRIFGEPFHRSPMLAMRDGNWKLLMNADRSRVELYDIPSDPTEMNNQAAAEPAVVERLADQLLAWHRRMPPGPLDAEAGKNDYPWPGRAPR